MVEEASVEIDVAVDDVEVDVVVEADEVDDTDAERDGPWRFQSGSPDDFLDVRGDDGAEGGGGSGAASPLAPSPSPPLSSGRAPSSPLASASSVLVGRVCVPMP